MTVVANYQSEGLDSRVWSWQTMISVQPVIADCSILGSGLSRSSLPLVSQTPSIWQISSDDHISAVMTIGLGHNESCLHVLGCGGDNLVCLELSGASGWLT